MSTDTEPLYVRQGEAFVPTEYARGFWYDETQHGGPPAALLAKVLEEHEPDPDVFVCRTTIDLKVVPMAPLVPVVRTIRSGRRVQVLEAALLAGEREVARALAMRMRRVDTPIDDLREYPAPRPPAVSEAHPPEGFTSGERVMFPTHALELRMAGGAPGSEEPGWAWIRLLSPLVDGEETPPLARLLAVTDLGNAMRSTLDFSRYTFINPDQTVYIHRYPVSEWVCLETYAAQRDTGVGMSDTLLHDEEGTIGRVLQMQVIDARPEPVEGVPFG